MPDSIGCSCGDPNCTWFDFQDYVTIEEEDRVMLMPLASWGEVYEGYYPDEESSEIP